MNIELLNDMILENYVRVQTHPTLPFHIYNYTAKAQYERVWNEITLACRGLILHRNGKVVARPFPKFFNLGEMEDQVIPATAFEVYEKMDGSLGISYWNGSDFEIATRGSFTSVQSMKATELLNTKYANIKAKLDPSITYLFEIIYPENRIVVDYGQREELVLLGMIETSTGKELPIREIGFPVVKRYDGLNDLHELKSLEEENREGFVIRFRNNFRLKVKFEEYTRIHRIITGVSSISIWEALKAKQSLDEILERVPDEFYQWVRTTKAKLETQYTAIEEEAKADFKTLATRKETALYFQTCKYPSVLFSILDERDYSETIWRMIRPEFEKPFMNEEEF